MTIKEFKAVLKANGYVVAGSIFKGRNNALMANVYYPVGRGACPNVYRAFYNIRRYEIHLYKMERNIDGDFTVIEID